MKNVRTNTSIIPVKNTSTKKVKRLQQVSGNSLWDKLEPKLPLPRKSMKFKSPYKPPTLIGQERKTQSENDDNKDEKWPSKEGFTAKNISSTVKIKPIDPYKFCESITNPKSEKDWPSSKAPVKVKKSLKMKNKAKREVLELIQKAAATIKIIRKQNEEWKKSHQSMSFLETIEEQHANHRKIKK